MVTSEQIENLFYNGSLLPLCESSEQELNIFQKDETEYVRRQEDLSCYSLRKAVLELLQVHYNEEKEY